MYINFKFLLSALSAVFLLSLVVPVFSFQPSGGVLMLDGEDDLCDPLICRTWIYYPEEHQCVYG